MHPAGPPAHTSTKWPTEGRHRAWLYLAIALLLALLAGLLTFLYSHRAN